MTMSLSDEAVVLDSDERQVGSSSVTNIKSSSDNESELDLGVLSELIGYQLRRAQMRIYNSFAKQFEFSKITPTQFGLLVKIKYNAGISQTALARANGIERSTLGEIIDRFEKRGWVVRQKHATDRRAYALKLSPAGETAIKEFVPAVVAHEQAVFAEWPTGDQQKLLALLTRLGDEDAG